MPPPGDVELGFSAVPSGDVQQPNGHMNVHENENENRANPGSVFIGV